MEFQPDKMTYRFQVDLAKYMHLGEPTIQKRAYTDLVMIAEATLFGQAQEQEYFVSFKMPTSWWQHFKQKYFPGWALKRWPVKAEYVKRSVKFNHFALFPVADLLGRKPDVIYTEFRGHGPSDPNTIYHEWVPLTQRPRGEIYQFANQKLDQWYRDEGMRPINVGFMAQCIIEYLEELQ